MHSWWMNISESLRIRCKICTWNSMSIIFKGFGHKLPVFVFQLQNCMTSDNLHRISVPSFVYLYNMDKNTIYGIINAVYRYSSFYSSWHTAGLCATAHLKVGEPMWHAMVKKTASRHKLYHFCADVLRASVCFTTFFLSTVMMSDFE